MKDQTIINYYKEYKYTPGQFIDMLQKKAYFAKVNNVKLNVASEMMTGKEIEEILVRADDLVSDGKII